MNPVCPGATVAVSSNCHCEVYPMERDKVKLKVKVKDLLNGDVLVPTNRVVVRADYGRVVLSDGITRMWNPNTIVTVMRG